MGHSVLRTRTLQEEVFIFPFRQMEQLWASVYPNRGDPSKAWQMLQVKQRVEVILQCVHASCPRRLAYLHFSISYLSISEYRSISVISLSLYYIFLSFFSLSVYLSFIFLNLCLCLYFRWSVTSRTRRHRWHRVTYAWYVSQTHTIATHPI